MTERELTSHTPAPPQASQLGPAILSIETSVNEIKEFLMGSMRAGSPQGLKQQVEDLQRRMAALEAAGAGWRAWITGIVAGLLAGAGGNMVAQFFKGSPH